MMFFLQVSNNTQPPLNILLHQLEPEPFHLAHTLTLAKE